MNELGIRSTVRPWEAATERARAAIERLPSLYVRIAHHRTPERDGLDPTTDMVVEGYPRSGNSFLVSWIARANPSVRIASHMHSAAHVRAALRRDVPVVVVVREPEAALASAAVYNPRLPLDLHIERYHRFHTAVIDVVDDVIISPFAVTTGQPARVVEALRARTGLELAAEPPGGVAEVMAEVDRRTVRFNGTFNPNLVARPSDARASANQRAREALREWHASSLAHLHALHDRLATAATAITVG